MKSPKMNFLNEMFYCLNLALVFDYINILSESKFLFPMKIAYLSEREMLFL